MAGPLPGISAAEIAQQKLPEQAAQKQSPSKFDQALKSKGADQSPPTHQVNEVEHAHKVEQLRHVEQVDKSQKARLDKAHAHAGTSDQHDTKTDPVTHKTEVSKTTSAI